MTLWITWRMLKWIGLLGLGYGLAGGVWGRGAARERAGLLVFPLSLLLVFVAGYGLLELQEKTFAEPWVSASLLAGVGAAAGVALHAASARSRVGAGLAVGGVLACVGFMAAPAALAVGALMGVLGGVVGAFTAAADDEPSGEAALAWFRWLARAEGVSLLVLFGVAMPVKYGLGEPIVVAWTGWLHGVLFLLYVAGLGVGMARLGWSPLTAVFGFVASLVPFGTFLFERRLDSAGRDVQGAS
jgi:integral membrane protein